jgi:hypothetical protein
MHGHSCVHARTQAPAWRLVRTCTRRAGPGTGGTIGLAHSSEESRLVSLATSVQRPRPKYLRAAGARPPGRGGGLSGLSGTLAAQRLATRGRILIRHAPEAMAMRTCVHGMEAASLRAPRRDAGSDVRAHAEGMVRPYGQTRRPAGRLALSVALAPTV